MPVLAGCSASPGGAPASVQRDQNRPLRVVLDAGRPDVEHQAIFTLSTGLVQPMDQIHIVNPPTCCGLRSNVAKVGSIADAGPLCWFCGRHETVLGRRGAAVGNALENSNAVNDRSSDLA